MIYIKHFCLQYLEFEQQTAYLNKQSLSYYYAKVFRCSQNGSYR